MAKQKKNKLIKLEDTPILKAIDINSIGDNGDPCFGKEYDLSTEECRSCGDSELCCIKFAALMGKTRKELEEEKIIFSLRQHKRNCQFISVKEWNQFLKNREGGN